MNSRIKSIREAKHLTLEAFGERIGVTRAAISNIEKGRSNASDQLLRSICREFGVSETWLRTGEGKMFPPMTRTAEISMFAEALMADSPDSIRSVVISYLMKWDVEDWEAVAEILKKHGLPKAEKKEEEQTP